MKQPGRGVLPILVSVLVGTLLTVSACEDPMSTPQDGTSPHSTSSDPHFGHAGHPIAMTPVRMVLAPSGRLLVTDAKAGMVFGVDPATLQPNEALRVGGKPVALGLAGNRVLVGNVATQTVEVFNPTGRFQYAFGGGPGAVQYPTDLAVDIDADLVFVVDAGAKQVKVFDLHGRLERVISGPGPEPAQLQRPVGIAVDPSRREILVSDAGTAGDHAAIKFFGYDGTYSGEISGKGKCGMLGCSGGFSTPQGLALDSQGRVYLADVLLAQILVYDRETGELLTALGGRHIGPPGLRVPFDVVIDENTDLYVTSYGTGTVEVFRNGAGSP